MTDFGTRMMYLGRLHS